MSLKKALERWDNRVSHHSLQKGLLVGSARSGNVTFIDLKLILEALAEPDEGLTATETVMLEQAERQQKLMDWVRAQPEWTDLLQKYHQKDTPALKFGDLVEEKGGQRAIFQRYLNDPVTCWVLTLNGTGDFIGTIWNIKDDGLKLIQRGFCDVSLKRIRDKLRSKD